MGLEFPLVFGMYAVEIGKSETDKSIKCDVYKLRNMQTGVIEAETSSLPRAIISASASNLTVARLLKEVNPTEKDIINVEDEFNALEGNDVPPDGIH